MLKKKILLMDDEPLLREVMRDLLQNKGFTVYECCNGKQAFDLLSKESIDCIVSEHLMPCGGGVELSKTLVASKMEIPVIFLLASYNSITLAEARKHKIRQIFEKPFSPSEVVKDIIAYLRIIDQQVPIRKLT